MLRPSVSCQNEDGGLCCYSAKPAGFTLQIYFSGTIFTVKDDRFIELLFADVKFQTDLKVFVLKML